MPKNNDNELPVDKSEGNIGKSDRDANAALREQNIAAAEENGLIFSKEDGVAKVSKAAGINPSSTYPGRDKELAEADMALPTEIDLAKRAAFAGSQTPARVHAAGLDPADFESEVQPEDAPADDEKNA